MRFFPARRLFGDSSATPRSCAHVLRPLALFRSCRVQPRRWGEKSLIPEDRGCYRTRDDEPRAMGPSRHRRGTTCGRRPARRLRALRSTDRGYGLLYYDRAATACDSVGWAGEDIGRPRSMGPSWLRTRSAPPRPGWRVPRMTTRAAIISRLRAETATGSPPPLRLVRRTPRATPRSRGATSKYSRVALSACPRRVLGGWCDLYADDRGYRSRRYGTTIAATARGGRDDDYRMAVARVDRTTTADTPRPPAGAAFCDPDGHAEFRAAGAGPSSPEPVVSCR